MSENERHAEKSQFAKTNYSKDLMIDWNSLWGGIKLFLVMVLFGWTISVPFGSVSKLRAKLKGFQRTRRIQRQLKPKRRA